MKNLLLLACCACLLCACGGNARKAKLPDATEGYSINCNGEDKDWADCYNQAADVCNGKYDIVANNNSAVGQIAMRNIIVRCK